MRQWTKDHLGVELEIVYLWWRQPKLYLMELLDDASFEPGFHVLPPRWVVERTFSWFGHSGWLSRDYERLPASSEVLIHITRPGFSSLA